MELVAEYNSGGTLLRRYVHGPGVDEPLVWYEGTTTTNKTWLYQDQLGSVIGTANSAGTSTAIHSYGPYGEPNIATGIRFRYTGQQFLGSLNLYYYKARFYSPALGRFLQTDPIGIADDLNLYAYVGNNPINANDPNGEFANVLIGGGTSVLLGGVIRYISSGGNWDAVIDTNAIAVDAALGSAGAGILGKINSLRKLGEINQLTNTGRALVTSGAEPKFSSTISQYVTKAEANSLGKSFTSQGEQFSYRAPAYKHKLDITQANFESTIPNAIGNPKAITNIHATVTRFGTQIEEGLIGGGLGGASVGLVKAAK